MTEADVYLDGAIDRAMAPAIMHADPEKFQNMLVQAETNWSSLLSWLRSTMVLGVDYGVIESVQNPKPSLWQPGAEKICARLGWRCHFPDAEKYVDVAVSGQRIAQVVLRCQLFNSAGTLVGEGMGAAEATTQQRRWVGKGQDRHIDGFDDVYDANKALKMAKKSAMIDAVKSTAGLSAIFTQNLPDEGQDTTPLGERPSELLYIETLAQELAGDGWMGVLQSFAMQVIHIPSGDYKQIPVFRVPYMARRLKKKYQPEECA